MKHIRVLYDLQRLGNWAKESFQHGKEDIKGIVNIAKEGGVMGTLDLMWQTKKKISNAEDSKNPVVKQTLELLKVTGIIEEWVISNGRILKRFGEWSGRSWALSIIDALDKAESGQIQIVTYAGNQYKAQSLDSYREEVKQNPERVNIWAIPWLINLQKQWKNHLSLGKETWENISVYSANRNWNTRIIGESKEIATFLGTLYGEKKVKEEWIYDGILKEFIGKMDEGTLKKLLTENKLEKTANGKIDIGKIIMELKVSNVEEIPKKLAEKSEKLKEDGIKLLKIAREEQKSLVNIKDLESLWLSNLSSAIKNKSFASFSPEECIKYIPIVDELFKKEGNPKRKEEIKKIQGILIAVKEGYEKVKNGWALTLQAKEASKLIKQKPDATIEDTIRNAESSEVRKKESLAEVVSVTRAGIEQWKNILKDMNIDISSFEDLQKKYHELVEKEKNGWLTKEEERAKAQLYGQIQLNIWAAQVVKNYEWFLTKEDIKEVFIDTNRFISGNPTEQYNFQALEKIAILTDPEASIGARNFARLEPGQTMSMGQFVEWELRSPLSSAPEISNISVSMNQYGTYDIPTLWAVNLSKEQVQEYMTNVSLYADMWLSQFIPHLTMLTGELRNKWVNTAIDGSSNTMEQQQVLKALYSQLFGKEIISSSLGDVERAYSSALGNPTSMKNAIQAVLKTHRLIWESGWSIAADTLQKWIRQNKTENQKPTINLT